MSKANFVVGNRYNWRDQKERLTYLGKKGVWHQFALVGTDTVWCEVLEEDLHMIEETVSGDPQ